MLRNLALPLFLCVGLAGCSGLSSASLNPANWFGKSTGNATQTPAEIKPLVPERRRVTVVDARVLIAEVTALEVARTPGGAIIRATGIAASQGYFNAQLVPVSSENGVLTYDFRVEAPAGYEPLGSAASRQITVAEVLTLQELRGIRQIVVRGASNSRSSQR